MRSPLSHCVSAPCSSLAARESVGCWTGSYPYVCVVAWLCMSCVVCLHPTFPDLWAGRRRDCAGEGRRPFPAPGAARRGEQCAPLCDGSGQED
eukprot:289159-Alexandrium_andersonii.AAC.1